MSERGVPSVVVSFKYGVRKCCRLDTVGASGAVRWPPVYSWRSNSVVSKPENAHSAAAVQPEIPAPTTATVGRR